MRAFSADVGMTEIWCSGGGVQSAAIAALIVQGHLRPDLAVISDTEREQATTWDYMDSVISPALQSVGVTLHRVKKSKYATVDLYGGADGNTLLIPAFTTKGQEVGKLPGYCSNEWKRRVVQRWATKEHGVSDAVMWLGISVDELKRASPGAGQWKNRFPLIERKMNRGDCVALVERMGWPTPPRSSCWMCPNHTQHEWRAVKESEDWERTVTFDRYIRKQDPHVWLHGDGAPIETADLTDYNESLFDRCDSGLCFT